MSAGMTDPNAEKSMPRDEGPSRTVAQLLEQVRKVEDSRDALYELAQALERSAEACDDEVLHRVVELSDAVPYYPASWQEADDNGCELGPDMQDCTLVKQLARQELARRKQP